MGAYADGSEKGTKTRAQAIADGKNRKNNTNRNTRFTLGQKQPDDVF